MERVGLINNPKIYSTVHVGLVSRGSGEVKECIYDCAVEYADKINAALREFSTDQNPTNNLMESFDLYTDQAMEQSIKDKVSAAIPTVCAVGDRLLAALHLEMSDDLTDAEYDAFVENIKHQYEYGWGAEFELQDIPISDSDAVCLRLHHPQLEFHLPAEIEPPSILPEQAPPNTLLALLRSGINFSNVILHGKQEPGEMDYDALYRCANNKVQSLNRSLLAMPNLSEWADVLTAPVSGLSPGRHEMTLLMDLSVQRVADFAEAMTAFDAQMQVQDHSPRECHTFRLPY